MPTVPDSSAGNAAGTTLQDYVTAFYNALVAQPGDFTISNVVGGAAPTSWTITHSDGWQINYRVSGGTLLSLIAPEGGIANSAAPGTPTHAYAEDVIIPAPSGSSTRWQYDQYGDALTFAINGSANTFSQYCIHQGAIRTVNNAANASDGLGTLAYTPSEANASTAGVWFNQSPTASNRKSWLRYKETAWGQPFLPVTLASYTTQIDERLAELPSGLADAGVTPSIAAAPPRGTYRYLRIDTSTTAQPPLSVLPDPNSNQGWRRLNSSASATRMVIMTNKTVTP